MKPIHDPEGQLAPDIEPESIGTTEAKAVWGMDSLGSLLKSWPQPQGTPEEPAFLCHCSSLDMQDDLLVNMLQAYGIPALKKYPFSGSFGKVLMGMSGDGSDIFVPASLLEDAQALIGGESNE